MRKTAAVLGFSLSCFALIMPLAVTAGEEFKIEGPTLQPEDSTTVMTRVRVRMRVIGSGRERGTVVYEPQPLPGYFIPVQPKYHRVYRAKPAARHRAEPAVKPKPRLKPRAKVVSKPSGKHRVAKSQPAARKPPGVGRAVPVARSAADRGARRAIVDLRRGLAIHEKGARQKYASQAWLNRQGFVKKKEVAEEVNKALKPDKAKVRSRWHRALAWGIVVFAIALGLAMALLAESITVFVLRLAAATIFALTAAVAVYLLLSLVL